jgi:hypothetical protein
MKPDHEGSGTSETMPFRLHIFGDADGYRIVQLIVCGIDFV